MGINRTAKGIVLVPCLLLGGCFLAAAAWSDAAASANRPLALALGAALLGAGLLTQVLPEGPTADPLSGNSATDPAANPPLESKLESQPES
jgi:Na+/glutamate symporter